MTTKLQLELTLSEAVTVQGALKVWRAMQHFNAQALMATDDERDEAVEQIEITDRLLADLNGSRG